jgi:RNase H-fold protein (predicted Holliday junction resolvase)
MRILAIDFGTKRTGIAVTDPLQIIASGLTTVLTPEIFVFLKKYCSTEDVERFVVGLPLYPDGNPAQIAEQVDAFVEKSLFLVKMNAIHPMMPSKLFCKVASKNKNAETKHWLIKSPPL